MRRALILAMCFLGISQAAGAANPDGPTGAIWIEGSGSTFSWGEWRYPEEFAKNHGDMTSQRLGLELGIIVSDRITFSASARYVEWVNLGLPFSGHYEYRRRDLAIGGSLKVWLRR